MAANTGSGDALGGGISNGDGTVTITRASVSGNQADSSYGTYGGGINNGSAGIEIGTVMVADSTISDNSAIGTYYGPGTGGGANGGGLSNNGATSITDSTVAGNSATSNGTAGLGGIGGGLTNFVTMTVVGTTVADNTANSGIAYAASIANGGTSLELAASIVALGSGTECSGTVFTDLGYNLDDDSSCGFSPAKHSQSGVDPDLGPLRENGGPTETLLPAVTSPAVGAIPPNTMVNGVQLCPRSDQRGVASAGNCTIGAVEVAVCPTGLQPHVMSAGYVGGTFTGLFCVNANGFGTYTQGIFTGFGWVTAHNRVTNTAALGKNLLLLGSTNGTKSSFVELAPTPIKFGTFTLS